VSSLFLAEVFRVIKSLEIAETIQERITQ
jgi:hypothetical protein